MGVIVPQVLVEILDVHIVAVPSVQDHVIAQEIPDVQVVQRVQEQMRVTIKIFPHERIAEPIVNTPVLELVEEIVDDADRRFAERGECSIPKGVFSW